MDIDDHCTLSNVEHNMGFHTLYCTSMLVTCMVVAVSLFACFVADMSLIPAVGACIGSAPATIERGTELLSR